MAVIIKGLTQIGTFLPTKISGLQLWLDANDSSTLFQSSDGTLPATSDGDPLGFWADKSGSSRNAIQTDGTKKPLVRKNILNGKSGIRADGVNDYLLISSSGITSSGFTHYIACRFLTVSGDQRIIWGATDSGNFDVYNSKFNMYAGSPGLVGVGTALANTAYLCVTYYNGASSSLKVNNNTYNGNPGSNYPTSYRLFSNNNVNYGNAEIFEIMTYSSILSSSDDLAVIRYLNNKWNIY